MVTIQFAYYRHVFCWIHQIIEDVLETVNSVRDRIVANVEKHAAGVESQEIVRVQEIVQ